MDDCRRGPDGVVELEGRLDVHTVAHVRHVLHEIVEHGAGDVVVDLGKVEVLDASGLGVLVGASRKAQSVGRRVVLRDVPARLAPVFTATRLHRILPLERRDALAV
ncbi:MAG: STAS domain-containing protein [Actinomycetota bacterium]|nr:STAS domain-containing protein [Actinomycetota bacterium]